MSFKTTNDQPKENKRKTIFRMVDDGNGREKEVPCQGDLHEPTYWWMKHVDSIADQLSHYKRLMPWYEANKDNQTLDDKPMNDGNKYTQAEHCAQWLNARKTMIGYLGKTCMESPTFEKKLSTFFSSEEAELIGDCIVYFNKEMENKYGHCDLYKRSV